MWHAVEELCKAVSSYMQLTSHECVGEAGG